MSWNTQRVKMPDPYRKGRETDMIEFADKEGVPVREVRVYYYRHGRTLKGFRERRRKEKEVEVEWKGKKLRGSMIEVAKAMGERYNKIRSYVAKEGSLEGYAERGGRRYWAKVTLPDGHEEFLQEYAKRMGVSPNTVTMYLRYHGDLKGFEERSPWRTSAPKHKHEGLGMEKTKAEWAEYYGVSKQCIKEWLKRHGGKMDGYREGGCKAKKGAEGSVEEKKHGTRGKPSKKIEWKGERRTFGEWAKVFGVSYTKAYKYWTEHNGSFKGIEVDRRKKASGRKSKEVA